MKLFFILPYAFAAMINFLSEGTHVFSFIGSDRNEMSVNVTINIRCISKQRAVQGRVRLPLQDTTYYFSATFLQAATVEVSNEAIPSKDGLLPTTVVLAPEDAYDVDLLVYAHRYTPKQESLLVLPSGALGQLYYVMSYRATQGNAAFSISPVDLEDTTIVVVYFVQDFSFQGEIYNINNPYQTTLGQSSLYFETSFDPTGTKIEVQNGNRKLHVVSGNDCAGIPSSRSYCNHISEALPPVEGWGSTYAVAPFHERNSGYLVRILAAEDNTEVLIHLLDITETVTLDAGAVEEKQVALPVVLKITANHPVLVAQFMLNSVGTNIDNGGPAMVVIPAIEHSIPSYLPFTSLPGFTSNHVTVWFSSLDVGDLRIDGSSSFPWKFVGPAFGGTIAQTTVSPGDHYLSHIDPSVRLCGLAYGYGSYVAYAHPIYFQPLTAANEDVDTSPPVIQDCPRDNIAVNCPSYSNVASVTWNIPNASSPSPLLPTISNYQSGDSFKIGTTKVIYQFSDVFGNVAECTFEVLVIDVSPPEIFDCPTDYNVTACDSSPVIKWQKPYAIDNSMENYLAAQSSQVTSDGMEVRYIFGDNSGNEATCAFKIGISYPNDCKIAVTRSSLEDTAIALGLGTFGLLMILCSLIIWDLFNKYVKQTSLSGKSPDKKSRNDYKTSPAATEDSTEPNRDSYYLQPRTSSASE